mgnify:CR=1 FL=1
MEDFLRVGVISSTHGVRGEVKVFPTTDDPARFKKLKEVILDTGREKKTLEIEQVKFFKNQVILKFKGFNNIDEIMPYKGKDLLIPREKAVPLGENENFIADLIDMEVVTDEGKALGISITGSMIIPMAEAPVWSCRQNRFIWLISRLLKSSRRSRRSCI